MRRLTIVFIAALSLLMWSNKASAQGWHIGGDLTAININTFGYSGTVLGGYEFNDKIAIQASVGFTGVDDYANFSTGAYFRYTPWHNDVVYLDLRFRTQIRTDFNDIKGADIGITPMLRFRCNPHWDFFAAFGSLGARYQGKEWNPCIGLISSGTDIGIIYRF